MIVDANLDLISTPNYDSLMSLSIDYSDGVIIYTNNLTSALADRLKKLDKPILDF